MTPDVEGGLTVALTLDGDRIRDAAIRSNRPVRASRVFEGRAPGDVVRLIPYLFAVCGTAQTVAALEALEEAQRMRMDGGQHRARHRLVALETVREHLTRIFLDWPSLMGGEPRKASAAASHRLPRTGLEALFPNGDMATVGGGRMVGAHDSALEGVQEDLHALVAEALGLAPATFLALGGPQDLAHWAEAWAERAPAAAYIRALLEGGRGKWGAATPGALPGLPRRELADRLAADADGTFAARPEWDGGPRETGPLARWWDHPLVAAVRAQWGEGLLARHVARLVEVASLAISLDALSPNGGETELEAVGDKAGLGTVAAARGRLDHFAEVAEGAITRYRILAPTEWNFHPRGPLYSGLIGESVPPGVEPETAVRELVAAVDPCVACEVELTRA